MHVSFGSPFSVASNADLFLKQNVGENCKFGERFALGKTESLSNGLRFHNGFDFVMDYM